MSVCISGAGLAGLATAIKFKMEHPSEEVLVINQRSPQSNTQIAGQRYRAGIAGKRLHPQEEILSLFASRNDGVITPQMRQFASLAEQELDFWQKFPGFVGLQDKPEWFGPQWGVANPAGAGQGKSVLDWFTRIASDFGVVFMQGEVRKLVLENNHLQNVVVQSEQEGLQNIYADDFILAGGNVGGKMFYSTNKPIAYSPQELAFDAGLGVIDSTIQMIHPFGRADSEGHPRLGCYETDTLSDAVVYLAGERDEETMALLRNHQAHYHFPEIAQRFRQKGSVVRLEIPGPHGTKEGFARVSHHYGHIGVDTTDGTHVRGVDNLYAVGDASGIGYWTNHNERFPGFALVKCLTDAQMVTRAITRNGEVTQEVRKEPCNGIPPRQESTKEFEVVRRINSRYLDAYQVSQGNEEKASAAEQWMRDLVNNAGYLAEHAFFGLSLTTAYAYRQIARGEGQEPFRLDKELYAGVLSDVNQELQQERLREHKGFIGGKETEH